MDDNDSCEGYKKAWYALQNLGDVSREMFGSKRLELLLHKIVLHHQEYLKGNFPCSNMSIWIIYDLEL